MIKQKDCKNYRQFITLNGHDIERTVFDLIKEQLVSCKLSNFYNHKFDLVLYYKNKEYFIEVKSAKRFQKVKGKGLRNSYFKLCLKDIFNKCSLFAFCIYWKSERIVYFVSFKDVFNFMKERNVRKYYSITFNQFFKYLKPKLNILDIINKIDKNERV